MSEPTGDVAEALETRKARLRERLEAWLDAVLAEEEPPAGTAPEFLALLEAGGDAGEAEAGGSDLYALWEAATALGQEVRLQGRAFKQLAEAVSPLVERQGAVLDAHDEAVSEASRVASQALAARTQREQEAVREAATVARREALEALLDTRDRMARATAQARPLLAQAQAGLARGGLLRLLRPHPSTAHTLEAAAALEEGCRLALARLDEVLERLGVREIDCVGEPFDPGRMAAVNVAEAAVDEGTVLEVYRNGYDCGGAVVRLAQVKVARPGAARRQA